MFGMEDRQVMIDHRLDASAADTSREIDDLIAVQIVRRSETRQTHAEKQIRRDRVGGIQTGVAY